jgi:hypothetical protein
VKDDHGFEDRTLPGNPIVWPGKWDWRMSNACNPGALFENGYFYPYNRTPGSLRPQHNYFVTI